VLLLGIMWTGAYLGIVYALLSAAGNNRWKGKEKMKVTAQGKINMARCDTLAKRVLTTLNKDELGEFLHMVMIRSLYQVQIRDAVSIVELVKAGVVK
jgi:hypothetical protein